MREEPFTVNYISVNNCFLHFTEHWIRRLTDLNAFTSVLKVEYGVKKHAYFSWYPRPMNLKDQSIVSLSATYAQRLGLQNEEKIVISYHHHVASVNKVNVSPVTSDDWEILEVSSSVLQSSLLDQIQVVWPGQVLVAWVSKSMHVTLQVDSLEPRYEVGRLEAFTDIVVKPLGGSLPSVYSIDNLVQTVPSNSNSALLPEHATNQGTGIYNDSNNYDYKDNSIHNDQSVISTVWDSLKKLLSIDIEDRKIETVESTSERLPPTSSQHKRLQMCKQNIESLPYRVHPVDIPLLEMEPSSLDCLLFQPYNVFVHRVFVPCIDSASDTILCKLTRVSLPLREPTNTISSEKSNDNKHNIKDSTTVHTNTFSSSTYVRLCVVEDAFRNVSSQISAAVCEVSQYTAQRCILVPDTVRRASRIEPGCRVTLKLVSLVTNPPLTEMEIAPVGIWEESCSSLETLFRMHIIMHSKTSNLLINSGAIFPLQLSSSRVQQVVVRLLPSQLQYAFLDSNWARCCKITVNQTNVVGMGALNFNTELDEPLKTSTEYFGWLSGLLSEGMVSLEMSLGLQPTTHVLHQSGTLLPQDNILIVGKCGSGRSTLARLLCSEVGKSPFFVHCVEIQCRHIKGKKVETLQKLLSNALVECVYYQPSVLVLHDLEMLAGVATQEQEVSPETVYFTRAGAMIVNLLEQYQVANNISVIAIAPSMGKLNTTLAASRGQHIFKTVLEVTELTKVDRQKILANIISNVSKNDSFSLDLDVVCKSEGYVVQDLVDLVDKAYFEAWKREVSCAEDVRNIQTVEIKAEDLEKALKNSTPLSLMGLNLYQEHERTWHDVGGLEQAKEQLIELLQWPSKYPELFEQSPLRHQSGLLLYGAPGTGKTMLAGAVAHECGLNFISIKGPELLSKYIGASEESVRNIFQKAQSAKPCVLFFDEFDSLAPRRGHDSTGVTDRVVNQLLTQLDGVESLRGVWVVAATSRPDLLDPALLRPGRLDRAILCPLPSLEDRLSILQALSHKIHLAENVDLQVIASNSPDLTGADLQAVLYTAQVLAVGMLNNECMKDTSTSVEGKAEVSTNIKAEPANSSKGSPRAMPMVKQEHLLAALRDTRPSLTASEKLKYEFIYRKFTNSRRGTDATEDLGPMLQRATLA